MIYILSCVWLDYMVQYFQCKNCVGSSPKTKKCVASFLVPVYIKAFGNRRRPFFLSCKFIAQKAGGNAERPLLLFAEKVGPAGIKAGPFFHNMQ